MSAEDHPAMELTRNPVDETWGFICREHGILRTGLTQQHAINTENKHRREDHPDPANVSLDLKAVAILVVQAGLAFNAPAGTPAHIDAHARMDVWCQMTGLNLTKGTELALAIARMEGPVRAEVAPF